MDASDIIILFNELFDFSSQCFTGGDFYKFALGVGVFKLKIDGGVAHIVGDAVLGSQFQRLGISGAGEIHTGFPNVVDTGFLQLGIGLVGEQRGQAIANAGIEVLRSDKAGDEELIFRNAANYHLVYLQGGASFISNHLALTTNGRHRNSHCKKAQKGNYSFLHYNSSFITACRRCG